MTAKDGETKIALIKAARSEFIEKGYINASLRSICKKAEVTTGAVYFFFKDKDDLFDGSFRYFFAKLYGLFKQKLKVIRKLFRVPGLTVSRLQSMELVFFKSLFIAVK